MKRTAHIILAVLLLVLISCEKSGVKSDRWEGFHGEKMRVMISEFFIPDEKDPLAIPEDKIKKRVSQRASLMLASYININLPREKISPASDSTFNRLINETLQAPETISSECLENNHCTVITEYDITPVNRELERLKKN
ncbi:MAG TPA: hypothetical protein PK358_00565 [Spirochaetota bacterium]|nr:hypothetical protein [Spirochaetota bacterium]HPJ33294.1 hypothetical protein [Spirochaetota bacterium]